MEILPYKRLIGQKTHRFFDMADKARRTAFDGSLRYKRTNLHSTRIRPQVHRRHTFCTRTTHSKGKCGRRTGESVCHSGRGREAYPHRCARSRTDTQSRPHRRAANSPFHTAIAAFRFRYQPRIWILRQILAADRTAQASAVIAARRYLVEQRDKPCHTAKIRRIPSCLFLEKMNGKSAEIGVNVNGFVVAFGIDFFGFFDEFQAFVL